MRAPGRPVSKASYATARFFWEAWPGRGHGQFKGLASFDSPRVGRSTGTASPGVARRIMIGGRLRASMADLGDVGSDIYSKHITTEVLSLTYTIKKSNGARFDGHVRSLPAALCIGRGAIFVRLR